MNKVLMLLLVCALLFSAIPAETRWAFGAGERDRQSELCLPGDVIDNGKLNVGDVSGLYAHVRGTKLQTGENVTERCDITGDGAVNIGDVSKLYGWIKGDTDDLQAYAWKIQNAQSPTTLTLAMMSDTHYCGHNRFPQPEKLATAENMALLSNYVPVDALVNLGDFVAGNEKKEQTREDLEQLMAHTGRNAKCPVFYVRGNHDDNGWYSREEDGYPGTGRPEEIVNQDEWYQWAFGSAAKDMVTDPGNPTGGYGYFDHEASKIRVFLLNTSDIPYILQEDGSYRYNAYECIAFSNAQLNFVARSLLFEDKEVPNDWAAMFLMHVPMDTTVADGYRFGAANTPIRGYIQMLSIISAYRKGLSYSFDGSIQASNSKYELPEHFPASIKIDYSSKGCGDVICFVNGHTHIDNASQKVGLPYSLSYGYTYLNVVGVDAFSTMVVDREKSTVSVFKYGAGRGPSQSKDQQIIKNGQIVVVNGEQEFGIDFSKDRRWVIPFKQFRPQGENLLEGMDVVALDGFTVPDTPATLSLVGENMIPSELIVHDGYAISKPILLKQNTQYVIPDIGKSRVYTFHHSLLSCRGAYKPVGFGDRLLITGGQNNGSYALFVFDKESYPDYKNFYIKEHVHSETLN